MARGRDPQFTSDGEAARMVKARKYVHISKDQTAILEKSSALWFADVKNQSEVIEQFVPKHVLETAKALHLHNKKSSAASKPPIPLSNEAKEEEEADQEILSQPPQSSPGTPVSDWSATPPRSDERPHRQLAVYATQIEESFAEPATQLPSQIRSSTSKRRIEVVFPQSDGPEDDMDVDIPMAESNAQPSVMTTNPNDLRTNATQKEDVQTSSIQLSNNTPTCAQPMPSIIPCTQATSKAEDAHKLQKRNKPMKRIEFSDDVDSLSSRAHAQFRDGINVVRMPNTKRPRLTQEIGSSASTDVGSVIKSTMDERAETNGKGAKSAVVYTPKHVLGGASQSPQGVRARTSLGVSEAHQTLADAISQQSPSGIASQETSRLTETPIRGRRVLDQGTQTQSEEAQVEQPEETSSSASLSPLTEVHDPYEHFCAVYPEYRSLYKGTFEEFVQACWFLDKLREEKSLKGLLYDDFVRYFSSVYLPQQRANVLVGNQPDPAVDCYNDLDDDIMFQRGVLRKSNLNLVSKAHPEQFKKANSNLIVDLLQPNVDRGVVAQPVEDEQVEMSMADAVDMGEEAHEDVQMIDDDDDEMEEKDDSEHKNKASGSTTSGHSNHAVETLPASEGRPPQSYSQVTDAVKRFVCELCGHGFDLKGALQRHHRSRHTEDRPFECNGCGKTFARRDHLTQHDRGSTCAAKVTKRNQPGAMRSYEVSELPDDASEPNEKPAPSKHNAEPHTSAVGSTRPSSNQLEDEPAPFRNNTEPEILVGPREPASESSTARPPMQPASNTTMAPPRLPIKPLQPTPKTSETISSTQASSSSKPPPPSRVIQSSASLRRSSNLMATQIPPSETSLLSTTSSPAPRPRAAKKYFDLVPPSSNPSSTAADGNSINTNVKKRVRSNGLAYFKQLQSQIEADPEEKARAARIAAKGQRRRSGLMSSATSVAGASREGSRG